MTSALLRRFCGVLALVSGRMVARTLQWRSGDRSEVCGDEERGQHWQAPHAHLVRIDHAQHLPAHALHYSVSWLACVLCLAAQLALQRFLKGVRAGFALLFPALCAMIAMIEVLLLCAAITPHVTLSSESPLIVRYRRLSHAPRFSHERSQGREVV